MGATMGGRTLARRNALRCYRLLVAIDWSDWKAGAVCIIGQISGAKTGGGQPLFCSALLGQEEIWLIRWEVGLWSAV